MRELKQHFPAPPVRGSGSHPSWVRELKPTGDDHVGGGVQSHPSWVRELKHLLELSVEIGELSHPSWVRELKHPEKGVKLFHI